jgi:hypothetical protein
MIGIISLIGDSGFGLEPFDQVVRLDNINALAWPEQQANGIAKAHRSRHEFGFVANFLTAWIWAGRLNWLIPPTSKTAALDAIFLSIAIGLCGSYA